MDYVDFYFGIFRVVNSGGVLTFSNISEKYCDCTHFILIWDRFKVCHGAFLIILGWIKTRFKSLKTIKTTFCL